MTKRSAESSRFTRFDMLDLGIASKERHDRFVQRVVASREVWGLKNVDGWVCSESTMDESGNRGVMPFWSDRAYAKQCAREDWTDYEPTQISLDKFLERWLPGMAKDGLIVGTNWNAALCGHEILPLELKGEIERVLEKLV